MKKINRGLVPRFHTRGMSMKLSLILFFLVLGAAPLWSQTALTLGPA
jgi:hypothetical protein